MRNLITRFATDVSGATASEYDFIAALLGVSLIVVLKTIRIQISTTLHTIGSAIKNA